MKLKKISVLACFNLSMHWFAIGIIIPIFTLFLMEKGFSLVQVGIAFAIYSGAIVLLELPTGGLADSIGRKKVYLTSLILQIIGSTFLIFVNNYLGVLICFIFQGAARSLSSGTMDAYFIDEFYKIDKNVDLQKEMAKIGTFIPIALGLGSLLGGFLPMTLGPITKTSFLNTVYSANFIIFILVVVLQFILTALLIKEDTSNKINNTVIDGIKKVPEVLGTSINYGIKHPVILLILIGGFFWGFSISGLEQFWQPRVKEIIGNTTKSWIFGLLTCGYFFADSLGNIIITPVCRLFKNRYSLVLFTGRLLMGLLYLVLSKQSGIIMFSLFYVILYMSNGFQRSPESAIFNREIPSEKRSTLISFASLFMQLGGITGSILIGFLAHTYSITTSWTVAAVAIGSSALLYLFIPNMNKNRIKRHGTI